MSVEIVDEPGRRAHRRAREGALALLAIPRDHPRLVAIAWTALLLGLCLAPQQVVPDERSMSIKRYVPFVDLVVHLGLFAGFAASWLRVGRSSLRWLVVPAVGLLLAVGTELAQGLPIIDRDPNLLDVLADIVGVLTATAGMAILRRWLVGRDPRKDLP